MATATALAGVRLSNDWSVGASSNGKTASRDQDEHFRLRAAALRYANALSAVPGGVDPGLDVGGAFRLHLGASLYYVQPAHFMARDKAGEVCTPAPYQGAPTYRCQEGQRQAHSCHLLFLNKNMEPAGAVRLRIDEPYRSFCNHIAALGTGQKSQDELLVTVQHFPIDATPASTVGELGAHWKRATLRVRLREEGGQLVARQDDACLGNPNGFETIQDARTALAVCREQPHLSPVQVKAAVVERNKKAVNAREQGARQKAPAKYMPWIPAGFQLYSADEHDLDGDGLQDAVLVLESMDAATRRLIVLKGVSAGTFVKTGQSDNVVYCATCTATIRTHEDAFKELMLENNQFTIGHEVAGGDHWAKSMTFAWSRRDSQWQLVEYRESWQDPLAGTGADCVYKPPQDFGKIALENIRPEQGFLLPKAKGRCSR